MTCDEAIARLTTMNCLAPCCWVSMRSVGKIFCHVLTFNKATACPLPSRVTRRTPPLITVLLAVCPSLTELCCLYRLCETYHAVSQLPLASPTFTHRLDPHWPLCTYDIRGSCRDAKCEFQHASDYRLENVAVLRDLHSQAVRSVSAYHEALACFLPAMHATC